MTKHSLHICLINRNYPPEKGATGYFASQLVARLQDRDYKVSVMTIGERSDSDLITYVPLRYHKGGKLSRLIGAYRESKELVKKAKRLNADVYVVMTDPALLNYWASKYLRKKTWVYWSMDLFPEGFKANGLTSPTSIAYTYYQKTLRKGNPSYILALGEQQLGYIRKNYFPDAAGGHIPIGLRGKVDATVRATNSDNLTVAYVGNVGEAHDPQLIAKALLRFASRGYRVIVRCYGVGSGQLLSLIKETEIEVFDFVSDEVMSQINLQIVSLQEDWTHICVPSKAISAIQSGSAILFLGSSQSDTWQMLQKAGWIISLESDVVKVIDNITADEIRHRQREALQMEKALEANYNSGLSSFFAFLDQIKPTT